MVKWHFSRFLIKSAKQSALMHIPSRFGFQIGWHTAAEDIKLSAAMWPGTTLQRKSLQVIRSYPPSKSRGATRLMRTLLKIGSHCIDSLKSDNTTFLALCPSWEIPMLIAFMPFKNVNEIALRTDLGFLSISNADLFISHCIKWLYLGLKVSFSFLL